MKRAVRLILLVLAAAAAVWLYRGAYFAGAADERSDPLERIAFLERGARALAVNAEMWHALGAARLEAGIDALTDPPRRDALFRGALDALRRSLALNPLEAVVHFDLAQTLQYARLTGLESSGGNPVEEYLAAARLAGQSDEIHFQAGRMLLARWASLSREERRLTQDILKTVLAAGGREERLEAILAVWDLEVRDNGVLRAILPESAPALRRAADFLAQRSLERGERLRLLVEAEVLDFAAAKAAEAQGRSDFTVFRYAEAEEHYKAGLALLKGILFYQSLTGGPGVDADEYAALRRGCLLGLAKCRAETTRSLEASLSALSDYLDFENRAAEISALEKSLRDLGLLESRPAVAGKDLRRLAFELRLLFLENRYRDVVSAGQSLERGVVVVPEESKADYAAVLEIVGDAYRKLDTVYESTGFYQKAKAAAGPSLGLLLKIRKNLERLNDAAGLRVLAPELVQLLSGASIDLAGVTVSPGTPFVQALLLEEGEVRMRLQVVDDAGAAKPYFRIVLDGRVLWEDFLSGPELGLGFAAKPGANPIEIKALNRPLGLVRLSVAPAAGQ